MERIYSSEWSSYQDRKESEIIEKIVSDADDYDYGRLETMQAQQNKLVEIVSQIFLRLSPEDRNEVVKAVSTYSIAEY